MNYYIDFDNTLYRTSALKDKMLQTLSKVISQKCDVKYENVLFEALSLFNEENIYNIYELCKYFSNKYHIDYNYLHEAIDLILKNGEQFVYHDVKAFLKHLKQDGHNVNLLTYSARNNFDYQNKKVLGSKLKEFFDNIIITTDKGNVVNVDYKNSVFIDDNPKDLITLYNKNAFQVVRIKRRKNKYSKIDIDKKYNITTIKSLKIFKA